MAYLAPHFSNVFRLKLKSLRNGLRGNNNSKQTVSSSCLNLKKGSGQPCFGPLTFGSRWLWCPWCQCWWQSGRSCTWQGSTCHRLSRPHQWWGLWGKYENILKERGRDQPEGCLPPKPGRWVFAFLLMWLKRRISPFLLATTNSPFSVVAVLLKSFLASLAYCLLFDHKE